MSIVVLHIGLAILLFYAINWVGEHSSTYGYLQLSLFVQSDEAPAFNFILKVLTPSVYIVIVSTTAFVLRLDAFVTGIWLVAPYYFGFRLFYNVVLGRALLLNWLSLSIHTAAGTVASYLVYLYLIVPRRPLFPSVEEVGNQLWVIIALFLFATLNNIRLSSSGSAARKNKYLRSKFKKLRQRYGTLIEGQLQERYMELVAYAILIHEGFNRPWIARTIERAVFPWGSRSLGPMQVQTDKRLSDWESVRVGVEHLGACFEATKQEIGGQKQVTRYELIRLSLAKYNRDENYIGEVFVLIHMLWAQVATEYRAEFERMHLTT